MGFRHIEAPAELCLTSIKNPLQPDGWTAAVSEELAVPFAVHRPSAEELLLAERTNPHPEFWCDFSVDWQSVWHWAGLCIKCHSPGRPLLLTWWRAAVSLHCLLWTVVVSSVFLSRNVESGRRSTGLEKAKRLSSTALQKTSQNKTSRINFSSALNILYYSKFLTELYLSIVNKSEGKG